MGEDNRLDKICKPWTIHRELSLALLVKGMDEECEDFPFASYLISPFSRSRRRRKVHGSQA